MNSSSFTDGTFTGLTNTSSGIVYFRGVRFADPPIGNLRWRAPVSPPSTHLGHVNASQVLQSFLELQSIYSLLFFSSAQPASQQGPATQSRDLRAKTVSLETCVAPTSALRLFIAHVDCRYSSLSPPNPRASSQFWYISMVRLLRFTSSPTRGSLRTDRPLQAAASKPAAPSAHHLTTSSRELRSRLFLSRSSIGWASLGSSVRTDVFFSEIGECRTMYAGGNEVAKDGLLNAGLWDQVRMLTLLKVKII